MTHAYTKTEMLNIANGMAEDEVMLGDLWQREFFNQAYSVDFTPAQWHAFIVYYSEFYGLENLDDEVHEFVTRTIHPDGVAAAWPELQA